MPERVVSARKGLRVSPKRCIWRSFNSAGVDTYYEQILPLMSCEKEKYGHGALRCCWLLRGCAGQIYSLFLRNRSCGCLEFNENHRAAAELHSVDEGMEGPLLSLPSSGISNCGRGNSESRLSSFSDSSFNFR